MTIPQFINKAKYDEGSQFVFGIDEDGGDQMLTDIRGWGAIQHLFKTFDEAKAFQDELGQFITDAINEKIMKDIDLT